jgi:hypothetical protein
MLVARRLAGLSALEGHYARLVALPQIRARLRGEPGLTQMGMRGLTVFCRRWGAADGARVDGESRNEGAWRAWEGRGRAWAVT